MLCYWNVEFQPLHSYLPWRFQKSFHTSSVWSTEFSRSQQQSSCTLFTLLIVGTAQCTMNFLSEEFPSPNDFNSRYFSIYLPFQTQFSSTPEDTNGVLINCIFHTAYFKVITAVIFIFFKLQTYTNTCVIHIYSLHTNIK